jgi:hypothetical protein
VEYNGTINQFKVDTVLHTINGLYKAVRVKTETVGLSWGRGHKEFVLSPGRDGFIRIAHQTGGFLPHGDPIVDSVTINY